MKQPSKSGSFAVWAQPVEPLVIERVLRRTSRPRCLSPGTVAACLACSTLISVVLGIIG